MYRKQNRAKQKPHDKGVADDLSPIRRPAVAAPGGAAAPIVAGRLSCKRQGPLQCMFLLFCSYCDTCFIEIITY